MNISLSKRLKTVASLLCGPVVADVGCDSAKLAVWLAKNKGCFVYASDLRLGPLEMARLNLQKFGAFNKVKLIQSDGLSSVPNDVDEVVVAGLGGTAVEQIVLGCEWLKNSKIKLVLQPQSFILRLKQKLAFNGFEIEKSVPVVDKHKAYEVIQFRFSGVCRNLSFKEAFTCGFQFKNAVTALQFVLLRKRKLIRILNSLNLAKQSVCVTRKKAYVNKSLKILQEMEVELNYS